VVRDGRICYPVLDRGRRSLEHHGAKGVRKRLLVIAHAILGCPIWRRNRCGLLVQWLLLPEHESQGRVVTWHGQEALRALLSRRYRARVHGDVPLRRVDVRRPWRSGPTVVAGGSNGGRGGVARVTTTAGTGTVVVAIVAIAAVVFLVPVVAAVGRLGRRERLRLRSRRLSAGAERHRSNEQPSGVQVDLLQKEVIMNFKKVREWRGAPDDGPEVLEALVEGEDSVINKRPQVG
jgi:hypothetical protein